MPAFIATVEGDEGRVGDVYFVPQAIHARRAVCDEWQDGEFSGAEVRRAPQLDKYEEQGWVPITDMVYEGWWAECANCWAKLTADEQYDDDDNEFILNPDDFVGVFNGNAFCCQACHDEYWHKRSTERAMRGKLLNMMQAKIESKFGVDGIKYADNLESEYTYFFNCQIEWRDGAPFVATASLRFDVPGTEHGALCYRLEDPDNTGDPEYSLSYGQGYHEPVAAFFLERTGRVLDNPDS